MAQQLHKDESEPSCSGNKTIIAWGLKLMALIIINR